MSDMLSIGASAVRANQIALSTVSENIANAGTAGYVRRITPMREVGAGGDSFTGMGVIAAGISRQSNEYLQASVRSAGADLGRTSASAVWLDKIQSALTGDQLSDRLTAFYTSSVALSAEPSSTALRAGMLGAAESAAHAFAATGRSLDAATADLDNRAGEAVSQLNTLAQTLAKINQGISRAQPKSVAAAQLADQRDDVLEQMSALIDTGVTFDSIGRATVRAGSAAGPTLVDAAGAGELGAARIGGNLVLAVRREDETHAVTPQGGALAGMVEGAERLANARADLDAMATGFVESVNANQAKGEDLAGQTGAAMFAVGTSPSDISLAISDGSKIAAASPGGGTRDASNLFALAQSRTATGFEAAANKLVSDNAATLKQRNLVIDAQTAIHDGAITARAEVTGVNLDDEAVDLMRFQQAYQASSKLIQVARDIFQSILEIR